MKYGVIYKYDEAKIVGDLEIKMIRRTPGFVMIHTNEGMKRFESTQDEYTEDELLALLD